MVKHVNKPRWQKTLPRYPKFVERPIAQFPTSMRNCAKKSGDQLPQFARCVKANNLGLARFHGRCDRMGRQRHPSRRQVESQRQHVGRAHSPGAADGAPPFAPERRRHTLSCKLRRSRARQSLAPPELARPGRSPALPTAPASRRTPFASRFTRRPHRAPACGVRQLAAAFGTGWNGLPGRCRRHPAGGLRSAGVRLPASGIRYLASSSLLPPRFPLLLE
jgi:hypothetical protein